MKKGITLLLLSLGLILGLTADPGAFGPFMDQFNSKYGTAATRLNTCLVCHRLPLPGEQGYPRNPYGTNYHDYGLNFDAIEHVDSDGDGFHNITEIDARTFPGDPHDVPQIGNICNPVAGSGPVKVGNLFCPTLQAAYNEAVTGDTIKAQAITFAENLIINRDIVINLEGGYDAAFTTNAGSLTHLRGTLMTTAGGGKITIENFILEK